MWWKMRDWFADGCAIAEDDDLRSDLTAPEYFYTPAGQVQLEAKDDMKKRGLPSPDEADALALTFAMPVRRKASLAGASNAKTYSKDWKPF